MSFLNKLSPGEPLLFSPDRWTKHLRQWTSASEEQVQTFAAKRLPRVKGQVAIIPIHGMLAYYNDPWMGVSSMPAIGAALDIAMAAKEISAVVFDVDSPGGTVAGTPEFGDKLYGYRGTKPMISFVNPEAASAAYWTATAADQVAVTPSGEVGSIGVWTMHEDISEMLEKDGVKIEMISAGKYKVEGNPFEPLTPEAREEMQRLVDENYAAFIATVARHRSVSPDTARKDFGEGRMILAKRAVSLGMADRVETFDTLLGKMHAESAVKIRATADIDSELTAVLQSGYLVDDDEQQATKVAEWTEEDNDKLQAARSFLEY